MRPTGLMSRGRAPLPPDVVAALQKEFAGQFAGDAMCVQCHADSSARYQHTRHARLLNAENGEDELAKKGCESCHGPGKAHAYAGGGKGVGSMITFREKGPKAIERNNAVCLECHQSGRRTHWDGSEHHVRSVACTDCHTLMQRKSQTGMLSRRTQAETCGTCHQTKRAQMFRNAHMPVREGKMDCSSCHNPHGSQTKAMLLGDSPNDSCYTCHAEKRGPFAWEHAPVGENCMSCHDPHGSTRAKMLKLDPPRLCQSCHIEVLHPTEARLPGNRFVMSRACMQCHQMIHGSNHPSGFAFTR
jgi:DmsE family decaheme c-type cytochrome